MNKLSGLFVTGTDTEVGKTLVSGALILKLREQGKKVLGFKPVAAGTYQNTNGDVLNEDVEALRIASQLAPGQLELYSYVLDMPVAPHLAAENKGVTLELNTIMQALSKIQTQSDCLVIEGAGGFLIPLNPQEDLGDFAQQINLPIILVVGMRLGCINHALLTQEAIKTRGLKIGGWIANSLATEMLLLKENIATLRARIDAPFLGHIPALPKELQKADNSPYSIEALRFAAEHIQIPSQ
ncbi:dethiobiotin synthase [Polynucleobacter sp. MWH-Berg-3C6]|uniref:dethiobiotin synthase n=1 Tax=Polynucleobacter sp. MWH-Berg-3C6 TaxID=1855882 RepID=UPI001C0C6778|nr:dethiobiotin synthase [Polynucleobacter sp. MWH-Berg-3C6]MBU3549746.1 dethiobiotin synthase [Polynucleobacter sp. MWH-Berg-3C6]